MKDKTRSEARMPPALYFGSTKMNNSLDVVNAVVKENGGAATLFVKAGDEYVRVATTLKKAYGSSAMGTILYHNSPALALINKGEAYCPGRPFSLPTSLRAP